MRRRLSDSLPRAACALLALLALPPILAAAPTTYLHATDSQCGGNSPCFMTIELALQNVDHGGTVFILSNITGSIRDTEGRLNVTLRGMPATVLVSNNIVLDEPVTGWTIRDLRVATNVRVQDVIGSLTIDNIDSGPIQVGSLTQDTNASIVVRNSTVAGLISILGEPGSSLDGSVLFQNNVAGSARIHLNVAAGPATRLDADVAILDNQLASGGGIAVLGVGSAGTAGITGEIDYIGNSSSAPTAKFGVIIHGDASGNISGPVTFHDNQLAWLAVLTTESLAGSIGRLTITENTVEALEFQAVGGAINGPVLVQNNQVLDLGGHTGLSYPLILVDGEGLGEVRIENNTAPKAYVVTRGAAPGVVGSKVWMTGNQAGLLTLESVGGDFADTFTVSDNFLAASADPGLSRLTVRALSGGDIVGGVISGNSTDDFVINIEGFLTGDLTTSANLVREQATIQSTGNAGGAIHSLTGNDFPGSLLVNGLDSLVRFNRLTGTISVIQGTTVDATRNWWGCNAGPGQPGCGQPQTANLPASPWLTFDGEATCNGSRAVATFDVLTTSNGSTPGGNTTPGSVVVTTPHGTVVDNPVLLVGGAGCSTVFVNPGVDHPILTMQLDAQTVIDTADCTIGATLPPCTVFADGFESGDTSAWSTTVP
jgi:hypothetical protein